MSNGNEFSSAQTHISEWNKIVVSNHNRKVDYMIGDLSNEGYSDYE